MVLLTMTPAMVEALQSLKCAESGKTTSAGEAQISYAAEEHDEEVQGEYKPLEKDEQLDPVERSSADTRKVTIEEKGKPGTAQDPSLENPIRGNPISHGQVVELWKKAKQSRLPATSLDILLQGSRTYLPPPKPKAEPSSEYKTLMARLRREEEQRSYHRLTNPAPAMETFAQRFPLSSAAHAFASAQQTIDTGEEVTYEEVKRQMGLIINVLVSIICCSVAIWKAARWWGTAPRLALSLSGSLLVGVAEVVIYMGYIRRVGESKQKEKNIGEVKEIIRTWVVGGDDDDETKAGAHTSIPIKARETIDDLKLRRRRKEATV